MNGLSGPPKAWDVKYIGRGVSLREKPPPAWWDGSENVGLSNASIGENPMPENLRVPPQVRPLKSRGTEEARLAERWLSVQERKVSPAFRDDGDKLHHREGKPDHRLRPLNDRFGDKGGRVRDGQNVRERSTLEKPPLAAVVGSEARMSASNASIGENPMPKT
ncbi:hypothetical protein H5410_030606 [Solanum commersonii]|uniref:Uncharacterized protein n=1 Tax=Solanum commersonii TaxID=4109 RepID=A0A9J5YJ69_SOLCO|nr:hypothetical protein H5410_030606 [Solanum commersonii]